MTQFFLYRNPDKTSQKRYPCLLDIQNNLLGELRTTVVIPLVPQWLAGDHTIANLNPVIRIGNESFVVMTQNLAGVDRSVLGEQIADLNEHREVFINAMDFALSGI
jgi:toxin CcdB